MGVAPPYLFRILGPHTARGGHQGQRYRATGPLFLDLAHEPREEHARTEEHGHQGESLEDREEGHDPPSFMREFHAGTTSSNEDDQDATSDRMQSLSGWTT